MPIGLPDDNTMAPPPEGNDLGSPVSPSGPVNQGTNWKKVAALGGGGLLAAFAASKMSGANGISFGEALGHLGKGVADAKYSQMVQQRQWEHEQHGQQLKLIHDFFSSGELEGIDLKKYPKIALLQKKYADNLINTEKGPNGEPLSPKETTELLGYMATAKNEIGLAKQDRDNSAYVKRRGAEFEGQIQNEMQPLMGANQQPLPTSTFNGPPTEAQVSAGPGPSDARSQVMADMRAKQQASAPRAAPAGMSKYFGEGPVDPKLIGDYGKEQMSNDLATQRIKLDASLREKGFNMQAAREDNQVRSQTISALAGLIKSAQAQGDDPDPSYVKGLKDLLDNPPAPLSKDRMNPPPPGAPQAQFSFDPKSGKLVPLTAHGSQGY